MNGTPPSTWSTRLRRAGAWGLLLAFSIAYWTAWWRYLHAQALVDSLIVYLVLCVGLGWLLIRIFGLRTGVPK